MIPLSDILLIVWHVIEILLVLYAIYHGTQELRERVADWVGKWKKETYRVKWTSIKDLIRGDHTEFIKLRMLRVYHDMAILSIDSAPYVVHTQAPIPASNLFSLPGRADINPQGKIDIRFSSDEHLKRFKDRVVLVGYTLNGTVEAVYDPPGVLVVQPVGKECLTYEAHFPPTWHYERAPGEANKPEILVFTERSAPLDSKKYHVEGGNFDYKDGLGPVDWLRVTIPKPPQDKDINIEWVWQKGTHQADGKK